MLKNTETKLFKIKEGFGDHQANGKTYKAGEIVPSIANLTRIFPNKFIEVSGVPKDEEADEALAKPNQNTIKEDPDGSVVMEITEMTDEGFIDYIKKSENKEIKQVSKNTSVSGKNVTDQFPVAIDLELMIYQTKDDKYISVDSDLPSRPLHDPMQKVELLNWLNNQD